MRDAKQQAVFYQQLGENIRMCRKKARLSQDMLAKLIGLTRTSLTNIENGRQHPPLHTLCDLGEKLKVDIAELLPRKLSAASEIDIAAMVGSQLQGAEELAFVTSAIGIKTGGSHGDTETQNTGDGGSPSR